MMATVDLDNQLCIKTDKVNDVLANFNLAAEFVAAALTITEMTP
jgi:hypothetical protein